MKVVETVVELRDVCDRARAAGQRVGLVPTMGFFHAGHRSLMDIARADNDVVVVTRFVNPTQFSPGEDLGAYPRDLAGDTAVVTAAGVDVLFNPTVEEMYPAGMGNTTVRVTGITDGLCGAMRPGHFDGMATVVAKLFSMVGPCRAYFGRKDFQQLAVVRRMAADLDLPVEVVGCPLIREADGIARSSRNAYLTPVERQAAPVLYAALSEAAAAIAAGERNAVAVVAMISTRVGAEPVLELEYVEVRDAENLALLDPIRGEVVIALAARVGRARLIDNVVISIGDQGVEIDRGICVP